MFNDDREHKNYKKVLKESIFLKDPLADPSKLIQKAYESEEDLIDLHNIVCAGLRKKAGIK